jgi:Membrane bound O-acyl transferase family
MVTFPHLAESDYREPLLEFSFPRSWFSVDDDTSAIGDAAVYGLFGPSETYWIEIVSLVSLPMILAAVTAAITYHFIVAPKQADTSTAYFLGYGVLLPFWLGFPFWINPLFDIRNLVFKFVVGGIMPTLVEFRLLEAIHGCCPEHSTKSLKDYVIYFASILVFKRDPTTNAMIPATNRMKFEHFLSFLGRVSLLGALTSILIPYQDLNVFGNPIARDGWLDWDRWLTWELYANSLLHAMLFQVYLSAYCEGLTVLWLIVTGYQTKRVMKNPLGGSTSPTDFWSRRWNTLVHGVLKGGVYKPLRKHGYSPTTAAVSTFLMSGLFHELLIAGFFASPCAADPNSPSCYRPLYGGAMVFFAWQALLIALEYLLGRHATVVWVSSCLPTLVITIIIIFLGIPTAPFFSEAYVRSGFFRHGQMGLPMIIKLQ